MTPSTGSGIVVRTWNDAPISRRDCDGYADATAMCQANGKRWHHYQRLDQTTAYLQALADATGLAPDQLVVSTTTGPNHLRGTWIHPRLAVDLARWLSPAFAVWMDGWFLEQTQQPQPAPQLQGDAWRFMDGDAWHAQPPSLRAAQYLLADAEHGGDTAIRLFEARGQLRALQANPTQQARRRTLSYLVQRVALQAGRPIGWRDINSTLSHKQRSPGGISQAAVVAAMEELDRAGMGCVTWGKRGGVLYEAIAFTESAA